MTSTTIFGSDLLQHNLVVFRNGEGALQTLPPLVDVIPEARLNLVIYFLRQDDVNEAYGLIKNLEPTVPQEYILKGVVNAAVGQESSSREHLKIAQQYFQLVSRYLITVIFTEGSRCNATRIIIPFSIYHKCVLGWRISIRMRHDSWTSMHVSVLFPFETV